MISGDNRFAFFGELIVGITGRFGFFNHYVNASRFESRPDCAGNPHRTIGTGAEDAHFGFCGEQILDVSQIHIMAL